MIIVTGGAGFIGSNVVRRLNLIGDEPIVVVDDLTDGRKALNMVDLQIADYLDKDRLIPWLDANCPAAAAGYCAYGRLLNHDRVGRQIHDGSELRIFEEAFGVLLQA